MGQVLHGSAATTHAIRAAIQRSQASIAALARRFDLNQMRRTRYLTNRHVGKKEPRHRPLPLPGPLKS